MRKGGLLVASFILSIVVSSSAQAKRRVEPLAGLTPKNFIVQEASQPLQANELQGAKVAIIPSQNFLNYISYAEKWFNPKKWRNLLGERPAEPAMAFLVKASDPRILTDAYVEKLQALGATSIVASSIPEARAQGATHYAVFDYYGKMKDVTGVGGWIPFSFTPSKYRWESVGGVQIFDSKLNRVLQIEAAGQADFKESAFLPGMDEQTLRMATIVADSQKAFMADLLSKWDSRVK